MQWIYNLSRIVSFRHLSSLLIPRIRRRQPIWKTDSRYTCYFVGAQVSLPYSNIGSISVLYMRLLVHRWMFFYFHSSFDNCWNTAAALDIRLLISPSRLLLQSMVLPRYLKSFTCSICSSSIYMDPRSAMPLFPNVTHFVLVTLIFNPHV